MSAVFDTSKIVTLTPSQVEAFKKGARRMVYYVHDDGRILLAEDSAHPDTGKEDGERLNWMEANVTVAARYRNQRPASDHDGPSFWSFNWSQWHNNESNSLSIRDAIDAARAAQSAPNKGRGDK